MDKTKFNIDELEKFRRKDIMPVNIVKELSKPVIKIEKVEDYYNFFVGMLRTEDAILHNMEHLWILGINEEGYSTCAYLIDYCSSLSFNYKPNQLFKTGLIHDCEKIILAYNKNTYNKIEITNFDVYFASYVYRRAALLDIELYDYIVISSAYDEVIKYPKQPDFKSMKESHFMDSVVTNAFLDMDKIEHGNKRLKKGFEEGQINRTIEIARKMLAKNMPLEDITEMTDLTIEEIEKIKSES